MRGLLFCHVSRADFASPGGVRRARTAAGPTPGERELSLAVQDALAAAVRLESFPKSQIDVHLCVLEEEDGEDSTALCVTAAGLALVSAGIPMLDLLVGASSEAGSEGALTVGYLPNLEQLELLHFDGGFLTAEEASEALAAAAAGPCRAAQAGVRECLVREVADREERRRRKQQ